jgi:hypothetical protein
MNYYLETIHFASSCNKETGAFEPNGDKSKIWVLLQEEDDCTNTSLVSGYIDNCLNIDEIDRTAKYPVELLSQYWMEHTNGGRSNLKQYLTPLDYWSDPDVKSRVMEYYSNNMTYQFTHKGDPNRIDLCCRFKLFNCVFELSSVDYDCSPPDEWYSESKHETLLRLQQSPVFDSVVEALSHVSNNCVSDLFGDRYFPVLKAPRKLDRVMESLCNSFKSNSKLIYDDEYVYIGIRSKNSELDTIYDIYDRGGFILNGVEWDWD